MNISMNNTTIQDCVDIMRFVFCDKILVNILTDNYCVFYTNTLLILM